MFVYKLSGFGFESRCCHLNQLRVVEQHTFRTSLGFKQYDLILTKEQSLLTKTERKNMETQHIVLGYRIDLYFHDYKLPIEIDENGHNDRNIVHGIKRQKVIEQKLGCEFTTIYPDKEDFDIFKIINEIFIYIKELTKKV